ncbi:MAG: hypothetical protein JW704_10700 [Anaerolineaceae bacterium]|nr:hypothetical protein [Anaerolineaceae bacterium]MBN2677407.1 hypothetical protein [Anaerolineaceae bacterium]
MSSELPQPQFCYKHPSVETGLRCNRCDRPICARCAIHTETGYRCAECIRGQQKIFDTARWYDFPVALLVSATLSFLGSLLTDLIGFFILLLSPLAGMAIAEAVRFAIRKRRNRTLFKLVGLSTFIGGVLTAFPILFILISTLLVGGVELSVMGMGMLSLAWPVLYAIIAATTCYRRLSGIQLR